MAGSLIKIAETTLSSPTASAVLTGIDSTFDVYKFVISNVQPATDNKNMIFHITKSGSADTTANYARAGKLLYANTTFGNDAGAGGTSTTFAFSIGNASGETANAVLYLFNFAQASEYSFFTAESSWLDANGVLNSFQGGGVHTVASASDGVSITIESGININAGAKFSLYGLKKS